MANASALPHFLGHIILIVAGQFADQVAGTLLFAATGSKLLWGHKDWGMQLSCVFSMLGIMALTGSAMWNGDFWAMATYATIMAGLLYGFFGRWLDRKFSASSSAFVRFALGEPRKRMRDFFLGSKIPAVVFAVLSKNWALLAAQAVYAIGDYALGASKVEARQKA